MRQRIFRIALWLVAMAMVAAACGGDEAETTTPAPPATQATTETAPPETAPPTTEAEMMEEKKEEPGSAPAPEPEPTTTVTTSAPVEREPDVRDPSTATREDTLIVDIDAGAPADAFNFNPYSGGERSAGIAGVLIDPLFILNLVTGNMEPWLAESIAPDQNLSTWTLTLRDGAMWSDGQPVTAADVVFTVEMVQSVPELTSGFKFTDVTVTSVDDLTVQFDLPEPDPRFALTAFGSALPSQALYVVPSHIWSQVDDPATFTFYDPDQGWPIYSGPYSVEKVADTRITYVRNNDWWGAATGFRQLPAPLKVEFVAFEGEEQKIAALDQGDLDWATNVTAGSFLSLRQQNDLVSAWSGNPPFGQVDPCPRSVEFNTSVAPFDSPDVRWGIAHLLNRTAAVDVGYSGFGAPPSRHFFAAYGALDRYVDLLDGAGLTARYPFAVTDEGLAAARLGAAGYVKQDGKWMKDGEQLSITITNYDDPTISNMNAVLVEQLNAAGIDASQDIATIPDFIGGLLNAGFEGYIFFGSCSGSFTDPWMALDSYSTRHVPAEGESISGFYSNSWRWNTANAAAYSDLVAAVRRLVPGDPAIDVLFVDAMELWLEDLPGIPLAQHPAIHPFSERYWTGWPVADDPYVQGFPASQAFAIVVNRLNPSQ